jgi:glycosyltransferase involved in cell wall biosynthesis
MLMSNIETVHPANLVRNLFLAICVRPAKNPSSYGGARPALLRLLGSRHKVIELRSKRTSIEIGLRRKKLAMFSAADDGHRAQGGVASSRSQGNHNPFGAVAIGRNEGNRLIRCLQSLSRASLIVYVDSGSSDGSVQAAYTLGVDVVELDMSVPFTAARARNAGFNRLQQIAPQLNYVQFLDGDCELAAGWPDQAVSLLDMRPDIAAVCGILQEREPNRSIYNWLCENEWNGPLGEIRSCAGNVMHRAFALKSVGGYREEVVAAEEDELCLRLRAANWRIWRIGYKMAIHDAAMTRFDQWWKRSFRTGYAFAQGADLHGATPERHFVWESRRALLWGLWVPIGCVLAVASFGLVALLTLFVYPLQLLRLTASGSGNYKDRALIGFFQLLARFPESLGLVRYKLDRFLNRQPTIIEHK